MNKKRFEQAFNAIFHDKDAFRDFCSLDIKSEVETFTINSRTVFKTSDKFKKYLKFIDKVILRYLEKNEHVVHSYLKEKSSLTAVKEHAKNKVFFLTDIKEFFVNISTNDVEKILMRDLSLVPISDLEDFIPTIVKLTTRNGSIPIGFVTSPQLSNAFLFEFDCALNDYCTDRYLTYTRYSDDIIISGNSLSEIKDLEGVVQTILKNNASEKLTLNVKKTKVMQLGNKVKILGLVITPDKKVTIDKKHKKVLESLLHFYINDKRKYDDLLKKELKGKESSLFGLLHYAKSIDPKYIEKLQRKYGAYALSALMEKKHSV